MTTNSRQLDPIPLTFLQVIDLKLLLFRVHLSSGFFVTFWPYVDDVAGDGSAETSAGSSQLMLRLVSVAYLNLMDLGGSHKPWTVSGPT